MSTKAKRTVLIVLIITVVAGFVLLLTLWGRPNLWQPQQPVRSDKNAPPRPAAKVLQGEVKVAETQVLQAPLDGTIVALGATEMLPVKANQLVLQIDSPEARAQLQKARAHLKQALAQSTVTTRSHFHDKLELAQMHLQSTSAMRQLAEKQLGEFKALQPAAVQALTNGTEAEQQLAAAQKAAQQAQAALDSAQKQSDAASGPAPNMQPLQAALEARRQEENGAKARMAGAMQANLQQREEISHLRRLQRELLSLQHSEKLYTAALQELQRSPEAHVALSRDEAVKAAQAEVATAEALMARGAINAPLSGMLTELRVRPGMKVKAGQALAIIDTHREPNLVFQVPASLAGALKTGQTAEVSAAGGKVFAAAIGQLIHQNDGILVYLQPLGKVALPAVGTVLTAQLQ